jgi:hypothetical protein
MHYDSPILDASPLMGMEEQHAALEVKAEEADVLVVGDGEFG